MTDDDPATRFAAQFNRIPDVIELWWYVRYHRLPTPFEHSEAQRMMIVRDHKPPPTINEGTCEICGREAGLDVKLVVSGNDEQARLFKAKVCFNCYYRLGTNDQVYEAILAARETRHLSSEEPEAPPEDTPEAPPGA